MRSKFLSVKDPWGLTLFILLLLVGCTRVPLQPEAVAGKIWLQAFENEPRGFYLAVDGSLLLIGS